MVATRGGQHYELVEVRFAGETTGYPSYKVHRGTELLVRGPQGTVQSLRLYGSTLEKQEAFKVFSYVVD